MNNHLINQYFLLPSWCDGINIYYSQLFIIFIFFILVIFAYSLIQIWKRSLFFLQKYGYWWPVGTDVHRIDKPILIEATGFIGCVILWLIPIITFWFIWIDNIRIFSGIGISLISCMSAVGLGLVDDFYPTRWRTKLWIPALAGVVLCFQYIITHGPTHIILPPFLRPMFGVETGLEIGIFYYIYIICVVIFCTNSINILAGVNGLEVSQVFIIALTLTINSVYHILSGLLIIGEDSAINTTEYIHLLTLGISSDNIITVTGEVLWKHYLSLYLLIPFLFMCVILLKWNWYPAKVFVGDSFCLFSGMLLSTVAILGHYTKTLLLLFTPQLFNFLFSLPQLFRILPCPRHRMPSYHPYINPPIGCVGLSYATVDVAKLSSFGRIILIIFFKCKLVDIYDYAECCSRLPHSIICNLCEFNNISISTLNNRMLFSDLKLLDCFSRSVYHCEMQTNSIKKSHSPHSKRLPLVRMSNLTLINLMLLWSSKSPYLLESHLVIYIDVILGIWCVSAYLLKSFLAILWYRVK